MPGACIIYPGFTFSNDQQSYFPGTENPITSNIRASALPVFDFTHLFRWELGPAWDASSAEVGI